VTRAYGSIHSGKELNTFKNRTKPTRAEETRSRILTAASTCFAARNRYRGERGAGLGVLLFRIQRRLVMAVYEQASQGMSVRIESAQSAERVKFEYLAHNRLFSALCPSTRATPDELAFQSTVRRRQSGSAMCDS
jgi:hypothetical protein